MISRYITIGIAFISISIAAQKVEKLKAVKWNSVEMPEPSDICYNAISNTFFIVSDSGQLSETDTEGKIIRKLKVKNRDFEAVYCNDKYVYCVDESNRDIYKYDIKTLEQIDVVNKPFKGARNKGYESFTYNAKRNIFILITERDPIHLFELDENFKTLKEIEMSYIARDISSATFHDGFLWLLSDENMMIMKLNPDTYEVLKKWSIPVINPEGIAFDKNGNVLITSDDLQRLYFFNNPEKL